MCHLMRTFRHGRGLPAFTSSWDIPALLKHELSRPSRNTSWQRTPLLQIYNFDATNHILPFGRHIYSSLTTALSHAIPGERSTKKRGMAHDQTNGVVPSHNILRERDPLRDMVFWGVT